MLLPGSWFCFSFGAVALTVGLISRLYFCFQAVSLIVGLAIDNVISMALKIPVGLSK